jgi:hypothetical protein
LHHHQKNKDMDITSKHSSDSKFKKLGALHRALSDSVQSLYMLDVDSVLQMTSSEYKEFQNLRLRLDKLSRKVFDRFIESF